MILRRTVKITNPQGLHARPASVFVKIASRYESEVTVKKGPDAVNGKSIMGLMTLAANQGAELEIEVCGPDAEAALQELAALLSSEKEDV